MKRIITYTLLSIYLVSFTDVKELLKFPFLVEHYLEDSERFPDLSLYDFMKVHYFESFVKDFDYKDDLKLPFKSVDSNLTYTNCIIIPKIIANYISNQFFPLHKVDNFSYSEISYNAYLSNIYHPPIFV